MLCQYRHIVQVYRCGLGWCGREARYPGLAGGISIVVARFVLLVKVAIMNGC